MRSLGYAFLGILIGGIFGFLVGAGSTKKMNKTERGIMTQPLVIAFCIIGAAFGGVIGASLGGSVGIEKKIGLDKAEMKAGKIGRNWLYVSEWYDPIEKRKNVIRTEKGFDGNVATYYNDKLLIRHESTSGSQVIVEKEHMAGRYRIFEQLKSQYKG